MNSISSTKQNRDATPTLHCLRLHPSDNVATTLESVSPGPLAILGDSPAAKVDVAEPIVAGHKVALRPIGVGEPVVKYGVTIGLATEPIAAGAWVHTHNCRSRIDERSHTLDRHTGAPTDMRYE